MAVYTVDPLVDRRWEEFLLCNPRASVFHINGWLRALTTTYQFQPYVLTTSPPNKPLTDGLVLCDVNSWITGRRLVSLPFSDHCDVLSDSAGQGRELLSHLGKCVGKDWQYAEVRTLDRPQQSLSGSWAPSEQFCLHVISLDRPLEELFRNFHRDCIQRKIRRGEREDLRYEKGNSEKLLQQFYTLMVSTRLRHRVPPQPLKWFRNLIACMGQNLTIRMAFKDGRAITAILTLSYKDTITYKYGCSDERFNHLGGTPFLFWKVIQEAKSEGMRQLDLGRSEIANQGLMTFKGRLGAKKIPLTYLHCSQAETGDLRLERIRHLADRFMPRLPSLILRLPTSILAASGSLFYRHMD